MRLSRQDHHLHPALERHSFTQLLRNIVFETYFDLFKCLLNFNSSLPLLLLQKITKPIKLKTPVLDGRRVPRRAKPSRRLSLTKG